MQRESSAAPARPPAVLPKPIKDALAKARVSWLKNTEVAQLLSCHRALGFEVSQEAPDRPQSGSVFLFNRKTLRFFRKDGHSWRKKPDQKTVRETHEKLKVGSRDMLNCYYAHSDQDDGLQRRCYWLLDGDDGTVLVHYLASKKLGRANSDPRCQSEPMLPHFWDTARVDDYEASPYPHKAQRCYHRGLQDTCMNFEQGPIITTAPDLDRACTSSLLPPLPSSSSSSRSRHPRAMMTIPSSSGTARQQYSSAMMGRPHAIATDLDSFMHRGSNTPGATSTAAMSLLGTTDGTAPSSYGDFKLGFREQPDVFDHETALTKPGSALSAHESGLTGVAPALDKGYMGRQVASGGMEPELMDESQCDMDAVRSMLLSRQVMSQGESASAPSRIVESGTQAPASLDNHAGSVTPHRRQPSNGASNQGYTRSPTSGLGFADHYLAGLQQPSPQGRQAMDVAMTGLHQAALAQQHQAALSEHAPLSERELRQSVLAGQGLQQAALIQQGLNQTALAGQNPHHSFSPITPTPAAHHDSSPWDALGPSPMIQDDAAFAHHPGTMTNHHLMQPAPAMPTGDMNQETLSTRSSYFARDPESARGTLQWPLAMPDSSSRHAYSPWPVQTAAQPQPGLQTHSQMPAQVSLDPIQQPGSLPGFRSKSLPGLAEQPGYGDRQVWAQAAAAAAHPQYATGFGTGLHTPTQTPATLKSFADSYASHHTPTQTPAPLKSFADSYASHQTREQAEALEYLRRSAVTPTLAPSWQSGWPANTQLPDLEARVDAEQQLMGQPDNAAAFASWMQAQRFHGSDLHCTV